VKEFIDDSVTTIRSYELWVFWAWQEIRAQYHRTVVGPFWLTMGMGIYALVLNIVFGRLLSVSPDRFLPWLICGIVSWGFVSGIINEASQVFLAYRGYVLQSDRPVLVYISYSLARNVIVFFHHILVAFVVLLLFGQFHLYTIFVVIIFLPLFLFSISWATVIIAIVSTRYRDVRPMISNVMQVAFFVTPIMFMPDMVPHFENYILLNPFTHLIALIREPLLGHLPPVLSIEYCIGLGLVGWWIAIQLYRRTRLRVAYWL
jgi:homopolymeric O-antigen transport system permease protein